MSENTSKKRPSPDSVIDTTMPSGGDNSCNLAALATPKFPKVNHEHSLSARVTPGLEDDNVEIADEHVASPPPQVTVPDSTGVAGEDAPMVGGDNVVTFLPHTRQHCIHNPFDPADYDRDHLSYKRETIDKNKEFCPQCHCYVCDMPAGECQSWFSATDGHRVSNHCCANDTNAFWKARQQVVKVSDDTNASPSGNPTNDLYTSRYNHIDLYEPWMGPRPPKKSMKCVKCEHDIQYQGLPPLYCEECGRIADDARLKKNAEKQKHFKANPGHFLFGKRVIDFTLQTPDPREMHLYMKYWDSLDPESPKWQIPEGELEYEAFCLEIGLRPSIFDLDSIFIESRYPSYPVERLHRSLVEGLSEVDWQIVRALPRVRGFGVSITASWDQAARKGRFAVELYLSDAACRSDAYADERTRFLGLWCDVFPLKVSDVSKRLMCYTTVPDTVERMFGIDRWDDEDDEDEEEELPETSKERADLYRRLEIMVEDYDNSYEEELAQMELLCSSGKATEGHICNSDVSFAGVFKRFYSQKLHDFYQARRYKGICFEDLEEMIEKLFQGGDPTLTRGTPSTADIVFGYKGAFFFYAFLQDRLEGWNRYEDDSIAALLRQIENLGHEEVDYVEGLTCELLPFQSQSVKWALERETMPGGIQSLFWGKVPDDASRAEKELWYNPLTGRFRRGPLNRVRGGFIAEEMGLGKTVISLAMILLNPAPVEPVSGTLVSDIVGGLKEPWDKKPHNESTSTLSSKWGSIISRGTLVICPASLVGQWVQEAKSKLADPGLVYSYHGQNRKRDALILSKNSIVVTTYQTIASDSMFHLRSSEPDYCPPLEQIRWWRIVCDEGHSLRDAQTQRSKAVLSLPGDHKWLVSGTPMNTSVLDLTNQFRFLGIEHADELLRAAHPSAHSKLDRRRSNDIPSTRLMTFVLGGIMMRHSQNMKYRGTTTTLMQLPKKTERTVMVEFSDEEKTEYQNLEKEAKEFYINFRAIHGADITKHYLKISSKLMPLRVACAGGKYPINTAPQPEPVDDDMIEDETTKQRATKRPKEYSKFIFESKFQCLIEELEEIRDEDPSSKSLVFSQFDSSLQWLQEELPKHGFQYRTLKGDMSMKQRAEALQDFQSDPPTTIFLLSTRAGAVGINLTQANRVFLMEPCFNPALESQAIGRVHRMGQTREVEITRFIVEDSIESRLVTFLERKYGPRNKDHSKTAGANSGVTATAKDKTDQVIVGNVVHDKAELMMDDFDLLFGVVRGTAMPDFTGSQI